MNNKTIITTIIIAVVMLGGYFLLRGMYQPTTGEKTTSQSSVSEQPSDEATPQSSISQTPDVMENVITYTNTGYSPVTLQIKKGETVTFKNQSSRSMWTASAGHPTHLGYPTTGGCLGSIFDACKGVQPDDSWSFMFDISGTWKYHNHLSPGDTGTVVVE